MGLYRSHNVDYGTYIEIFGGLTLEGVQDANGLLKQLQALAD